MKEILLFLRTYCFTVYLENLENLEKSWKSVNLLCVAEQQNNRFLC